MRTGNEESPCVFTNEGSGHSQAQFATKVPIEPLGTPAEGNGACRIEGFGRLTFPRF